MFRNLMRVHPEVFVPRETHWLPVLWNEFGSTAVLVSRLQSMVDRVYMAKGRTPFERIMLEHRLDADAVRTELREVLGSGPVTIAAYQNAFLGALAARHGRSIVADKTPDYGFCMAMLRGLFPGTRFVHIARDGRDVALSMSRVLSFRLLAAMDLTHWWSVALDRQYERGLEAAEGELPMDAFFELWERRLRRIRDEATRIPPASFLEVSYESLLADPAAALTEVHEFLELPGDHQWIAEAAGLVRRENRDRNAGSPERQALGRTHAGTLAELGFVP